MVGLGLHWPIAFGKSGVGAKTWQGSCGTPSAGYSERGSREIVYAEEYCYMPWIYFMIFCTGYPIKGMPWLCDAHYFIIAT